MALNSNLIYRYNFKSEINSSWNFQLQLLRGAKLTEPTGYSSDLIPDSFIEKTDLIIKSSLPDDLPFGLQETDTLDLTINIDNLVGDFADLKSWVLFGGQIIDGEYYPNQWRLLSNNGRGASDVNYNLVEFWGVQDVIPEQEFEHEFGKDTTFKITLVDVKTYLTNKVTDYGNSVTLRDDDAYILQHYFTGFNGLSQEVFVSTLRLRTQETQQLWTFEQILDWLIINRITEAQYLYLRNWIIKDTSSLDPGVIDFTGDVIRDWTFYKQLYDLTTQKGTALSRSDIKLIAQIIDRDDNEIGGLLNSNSTDGFFQYKTLNDILICLAEQFINKMTWKINRNDTLNSVRLSLEINGALESIDGGSVTLNSNLVFGKYKVSKGKTNVASSTVNIKAFGDNQNRIEVKQYGNNKQDTYDNKALFTNNIQIGNKENTITNQTHGILSTIINQLYYADTNTVTLLLENNSVFTISDNLFVVHTDCKVNLKGSEGTVEIVGENITSDNIDLADLNGSKYTNRERLIVWNNQRINKTGLNYISAKAYNSICSSKTIHIEFNTLDYTILPRFIGQLVICNIWSFTQYPETYFNSNQFILTNVELDVLKGTSKITLYQYGG
jgi:hypothetical protein